MPGPPDVSTYTVSIIFDASISLIIIAPIEIGAINGKVTYTNFLIGPAPSIEAAKNGSFGRDSNPANNSRNINGVHCHTSTIITVTFDKASLLNQSGVTPNKLKKSFTGPNDSWKTVFQITVIITGVVIIGIKKRTRKNL